MSRLSEATQLCPTLCGPMDCSPPGSSVHGIFQARILEWVAISFSRGLNPGLPHCRQMLYCLSHQGSQTQGLNPGLPHCRQTLYRLSHQGSQIVFVLMICSILSNGFLNKKYIYHKLYSALKLKVSNLEFCKLWLFHF